MNNKLKSALKSVFQALLVFAVAAFVMDWWRKPSEPAQAALLPLTMLDGSRHILADISRERTAVVYFWGSWCGICRYTSPAVEDLRRDGIPVASIALSSGSDAEIARYMKQRGLNFPAVNDADGQIARQWDVAVTPTVILVKQGKMVHHTTGISSYWGLRSRIWLADLAGV